MYLFGMMLLLIGLGFSLISRADEEQSRKKACLMCNGFSKTIENQLVEAGPGCDFDFRSAHPNLKERRSPCFAVSYHVEDEAYYLEPVGSVSIMRETNTIPVRAPTPLLNGDTIWTVIGGREIKTDFFIVEV